MWFFIILIGKNNVFKYVFKIVLLIKLLVVFLILVFVFGRMDFNGFFKLKNNILEGLFFNSIGVSF